MAYARKSIAGWMALLFPSKPSFSDPGPFHSVAPSLLSFQFQPLGTGQTESMRDLMTEC